MRCYRCRSTKDVRAIRAPWGETLYQCDRCSEAIEARQHEEYYGATHTVTDRERQMQAAAAKHASRYLVDPRKAFLAPDPALMPAVEVDEYADEVATQSYLSHGGFNL